MDKLRKIDGNWLKLFALICMAIDHSFKTGIIPSNIITIIMGRLAFPIFAFLVSEGAFYTRNNWRYLGTLFLFAIISEVPFDYAFFGSPYMGHQNVMWTFFIAVAAITIPKEISKKFNIDRKIITPFFYILFPVLGMFLSVDYNIFGIIYVLIAYTIKKSMKTKNIQFIEIAILNIAFTIPWYLGGSKGQLWGLLALIPLAMYSGKRGSKSIKWKLLFYIFYPAHLVLIYFLKGVIL